MQCTPVGVYQPRQPRKTAFFQVVEDYAEEFARVYDDAFEQEYGPWRPHVGQVLDRYLACGDPHPGFARVHCDACAYDFLLAFSCKTRCFCLSCHQKRALLFGEWLDREVLAAVPHRQHVFSIPKGLRGIFRREPRLLGLLPDAAWRAIREMFDAAFEDRSLAPGAVLALQTFGETANWNPHLHALVATGVFARDGTFHPLPGDLDSERLTDLFRHHLLQALLQAERVTEATVERLLTWRHHSGFQAYVTSFLCYELASSSVSCGVSDPVSRPWSAPAPGPHTPNHVPGPGGYWYPVLADGLALARAGDHALGPDYRVPVAGPPTRVGSRHYRPGPSSA